MTLEAVLFDLDNTLLLYSEKEFSQQYFTGIYTRFSDLMPLQEFGERMMSSTRAMVENDGSQTNLELFLSAFGKELNIAGEELLKRFDSYYGPEFPKFQSMMQPVGGVYELFSYLKGLLVKIVIATNPMFPLIVQHLKLEWAGLNGIEPDLITSVENWSSCKPNQVYFENVCRHLDVRPRNCLMVGNDALNDMSATLVGMKTYLTTDGDHHSIELSRQLTEKNTNNLPTPDYTGPFSGVRAVVEKLLED